MRYNVAFVNQVVEKICEYHQNGGFVYFITLTVRDQDTEKNIRSYTISNFFRKMEYRGLGFDGYIWTKELQRRGVIHYHLVVLSRVKLSGIHSHIESAWGLGFVFVQRVLPSEKKFRSIMNYLFKYIFKDLNDMNNDKIRRRMGRGGILRFRVVPFFQRVSDFSEFEYVGGLFYKGFRVKFYRHLNLVLVISSGLRSRGIDILELKDEENMEKMKYQRRNIHEVTNMVNSFGFQSLTFDEIRDIYEYHRFSLEVDKVIATR